MCRCLQHLYNLVHVDLSYNNLRVLEAAHTRLGNIKTLNLAGNQLVQLTGLTKLYSLVNLDLSHNQLAQVRPSGVVVQVMKTHLIFFCITRARRITTCTVFAGNKENLRF